MSKKVFGIIEGAAIIALGVLIAIFGGQTVLDIYFGVLFIVAAAALITFGIYVLAKTHLVNYVLVLGAMAALLFGAFLLAGRYSFGYLTYTAVLLLIAAGAALILYGVYTIVKFNIFYGIGQIFVGAAAMTLGFCYIFIPEFQFYFWIVVGVLVAVYGLIYMLAAIFMKADKDEEVVIVE